VGNGGQLMQMVAWLLVPHAWPIGNQQMIFLFLNKTTNEDELLHSAVL
jgi:hypothetical protein